MKTVKCNTYEVYPDRVTQGKDGSYRWSGWLDKEYGRRNYTVTLWTCAGISMMIMIITAFADLKSLWITGPCAAVIMGIAGVICIALDRAKGSAVQQYEMNEDYVRLVDGKYSIFYEYPTISEVAVRDGYLELSRKKKASRFYVPQEDMAFVTDYIISRCTGRAKVCHIESDGRAD